MKWYGEPLNDFSVKVPKSLPPYTEDDEIEKLFEAVENKHTHKKNIVSDRLLIELALKSGMRRGELADLEVKDIHDDFLVVREGKNDKDRIIPLSQPMALRLKTYNEGKRPTDKVFGLKPASITNKINIFAKKAGLNKFTAHTLRHKFATDLLEKGANIRTVQHLLGHENLATTQVYLSITDKNIREAINLLDKNKYVRDPENKSMKLNDKNIINLSYDDNKSIIQDNNKPLLLIRAVDKPDEIDQTEVMIGGYYSHFEIWNEGKSSACEVVIFLMDNNKQDWFEKEQIDILKPSEWVNFQPILQARSEGDYFILCQYKNIIKGENKDIYGVTCLPFKMKYASRKSEIYISTYALEFDPLILDS
jgi:hypothetical protein